VAIEGHFTTIRRTLAVYTPLALRELCRGKIQVASAL
jgi:hypothetical protein